MTGSDTPEAPGGPRRTAALLAGAAAAILPTTLGDGLLLPHVDRAPPRLLAAALTAGLLSLGWWLATGRRERTVTARTTLVLGGLTLVGGFGLAALLPDVHALLLIGITGGIAVPFYTVVAGIALVAAAPVALPLGALLGLAVDGRSRYAVAGALAGAALALLLQPFLAEILLGAPGTLQVAALTAAAAALVAREGTPWTRTPDRLAAGTATAVVAGGTALLLLDVLARPWIDLGTLGGPWLAAAALLGGALGALRPLIAPRPLDALLVLALPLALPLSPGARHLVDPGVGADIGMLAALGVPAGWVIGRLLVSRGTGRPLAVVPLALLILAPVTTLAALPRLGPLLTSALLAGAVLLAALLPSPRPSGRRMLATVLLAGLVAALPLGPVLRRASGSGTDAAGVAERTWYGADGMASRLLDETGERVVHALDGRAPLGRPARLERRLVHVPLLLGEQLDRVLVVASDAGEAAAAALQMRPTELHWLSPFPIPEVDRADGWPFLHTMSGSERLFFAVPRPAYDVAVMLPDPRARRRAGLVATKEFYADVVAQLTDVGLLCQWWDLSTLHVDDFKAAVASAQEVFGATYLAVEHPRSRQGLVALIGTRAPLHLDARTIEARLAAHPIVAEELGAVGLDGLLTACLIVQHTRLLRLLANSDAAIVDERPTLGARGGLRPLPQPSTLWTGLTTFSRRRADPRAWINPSDDSSDGLHAFTRDVLRGWQPLFGGARDIVLHAGVGVPAFEGHIDAIEAAGFVEALGPLYDWPHLHELVVRWAGELERAGKVAEAEQYLRDAIARDDTSVPARWALGSLLERHGRVDEAAVLYGTVLVYDSDHDRAREALARLAP